MPETGDGRCLLTDDVHKILMHILKTVQAHLPTPQKTVYVTVKSNLLLTHNNKEENDDYLCRSLIN